MSYFTYDTSVIISKKLDDLPGRTSSFLLSAVVLLELSASAKDQTQRKLYEQLFQTYRCDNTLIVPNEDDWLFASKVLYWLTQDRRKSSGGKLEKLLPGNSQRMALDVLLAVSARRWKTAVVTENWKDFKSIQRFCNVQIVKSSLFFRK
ncbi:MAG TPA: hypothetical protein VFD63_16195 [Pyrinomonadaceae bacterium]|nr:hypothetical protein [Pyrinomonadaceae bacterium]